MFFPPAPAHHQAGFCRWWPGTQSSGRFCILRTGSSTSTRCRRLFPPTAPVRRDATPTTVEEAGQTKPHFNSVTRHNEAQITFPLQLSLVRLILQLRFFQIPLLFATSPYFLIHSSSLNKSTLCTSAHRCTGRDTFSYLQISHLEGPNLLFAFNFPDFNQTAHVCRCHQGGVMAEHSTSHRVFVACR